jgi:antitoxin ParD1/3/4
MNVSLTPQLEKYIGEKVRSGKYQTASEVVREALRFMQDRDTRLAELNRKIQDGVDSLDRGEGTPLDMGSVRKGVQQRAATRDRKVG